MAKNIFGKPKKIKEEKEYSFKKKSKKLKTTERGYSELKKFPKYSFPKDSMVRVSSKVEDLDKFGLIFAYEPYESVITNRFLFNKSTFERDFIAWENALYNEERKIRLVSKEQIKRVNQDITSIVIYTINRRGERFIYRSTWKKTLEETIFDIKTKFNPIENFDKRNKRKTDLFPILFVRTILTLRFKRRATKSEISEKKIYYYHKKNIQNSLDKAKRNSKSRNEKQKITKLSTKIKSLLK